MTNPTITRRRNQPSLSALLCLALLAALAAARPAVAEEGKAVAFRRGVNLSNWLSDTQRQPLQDRDFTQIKAAGFDHVRIPVNPEFLGFSLNEAATGRVLFDFAPVDEAVGLAMANGLSVILDIQPSDGFLSLVEEDARAEAGFIEMWRHVAEHFKLDPPESLAFEILNAPKYTDDTSRYSELMNDIVGALRQIVPKHTLIIDAPKGDSIEGLEAMTPLRDPNIIYAFHFYEPFAFTHQGLNYGPDGRQIRYLRNLPYPSSATNLSVNYAPGAPDATEPKQVVSEYALADWNADHIQSRLKIADAWALANHVRILCTEFGARRSFVNVASRYRWITDTRKALESYGIGWDLWDYTDTFGIMKLRGDVVTEPTDGSAHFADDDEKNKREIDPEATPALFGQ